MRRRDAQHGGRTAAGAPPGRPAARRLRRLLCAAAVLCTAGAAPAFPGVPRVPDLAARPAVVRPLSQVVPAPSAVRPGGAPYLLWPGARIAVRGGGGARWVGRYLAGLLRPATGYRLPVCRGSAPGDIALLITADPGLGAEGYRLDIGRRGIAVRARRPAGLFHGVQTLRQLLPSRIEARTRQPGPWAVAGGSITDVPRYPYRGAMLDVARHFFTPAQVERYIDELAMYKVNRLHLHLTDDQGWRITVPSWPRLAAYGGSTEVGGGPGGFYTGAQYRRIVRYAASRFLTVVPEIDMPGHTNAALASYAKLNCSGTAPPLYTGIQVGFSSLCVPKPITYRFAGRVLDRMAELTPGPYLHIGGDEARVISRADYTAFMNRVVPPASRYGRTVMAWQEITNTGPVPGVIAQYWATKGAGGTVASAARAGTRLVLSPADHAYLDMKYNPATKPGLHWAGYVEVKNSYSWNPATLVQGAPASSVLGVEAALWTETLSTGCDIDYMAFPRLPAVAELGWSPPATHGWASFATRLAAQGPRWQVLGIDFYRSPQVPWPPSVHGGAVDSPAAYCRVAWAG